MRTRGVAPDKHIGHAVRTMRRRMLIRRNGRAVAHGQGWNSAASVRAGCRHGCGADGTGALQLLQQSMLRHGDPIPQRGKIDQARSSAAVCALALATSCKASAARSTGSIRPPMLGTRADAAAAADEADDDSCASSSLSRSKSARRSSAIPARRSASRTDSSAAGGGCLFALLREGSARGGTDASGP